MSLTMKPTPKCLDECSSIIIFCLISALGLKNVQTQSVECYSCTDQGGGECLPENALKVSCSPEYDACVEAIVAVRTSHSTHAVLKKGCGNGNITKVDEAILHEGICIYISLNQCKNASLCNKAMDLENYQLAPEANISRLPNNEQCYSCIGKPGVECTPSSAPSMQCYNSFNYCFDGNVEISFDNDTLFVPIKSCSTRSYCAKESLTYGSTSFDITGSCCTSALCNNDLSNRTQLAEFPLLVLNSNNEELFATAAPPHWLPANEMSEVETSIRGVTKQRQERISSMPPESNAACESADLPCILFILLVLFGLMHILYTSDDL